MIFKITTPILEPTEGSPHAASSLLARFSSLSAFSRLSNTLLQPYSFSRFYFSY
jgi:hypothetical protein